MNTVGWIIVCGALLATIAALYGRLRVQTRARGAMEAEALNRMASDFADLERERRRAEEILERMAEGVLVLDEDLRPVVANGAARTLLGLQRVSLPPRLPSEEVSSVAGQAFADDSGTQEIVEVWWPARRSLRVHAASLADRHGVVVVIQDITEELRIQRVRREFVAHASHELKSPVASIQALAEAIRQAIPDDPAVAERFSGGLVLEAERLGRLVGDLLDLSRLEATEEIPAEDVDLSDSARREIELLKETAERKGLLLNVNVSDGVWVSGDPQQVGLIIRNLLENAIRYTGEGSVSVSVRPDNDFALLEVSDTGIGIPLDAQNRVFERFYRVDKARSRDRGGTGLGLAIVKHAVEAHRGQVELASELGRGSTFTVRLPGSRRAHIRSVAG
jgi:two-component system, OmpR family, phosphate regulon sensor histidine kinase PhoR